MAQTKKKPPTTAAPATTAELEAPGERYQIRLTAADRAAWEAEARESHLKLSDWIRMTCGRAVKGGKANVVKVAGREVATTYPDR